MRTLDVRIPEPGEVWFKESYWGACLIKPKGLVSFNQGDEQFPSLLDNLGVTGNSSGSDKPPILFERDGWTVYESYAEFIEHRRKVMIANLEQTISKVNEVCDREIAKGTPSH